MGWGRLRRAPERTQDQTDEVTEEAVDAAAQALREGSASTSLARGDYWRRQAERALRAAYAANVERRRQGA